MSKKVLENVKNASIKIFAQIEPPHPIEDGDS